MKDEGREKQAEAHAFKYENRCMPIILLSDRPFALYAAT